MTPSGKVDRQQLPAPENMIEPSLKLNSVAPRSQQEEILTVIWSELLGVKHIGIHDDFFSLGGHSLLATRLVSRIRDAFQVELSLPTLFQNPTVARLSASIDETREREPESESRPIEPVSRDRFRRKPPAEDTLSE